MVHPMLTTKNLCIAAYVVVFGVTIITIISVIATSNSRNDDIKVNIPTNPCVIKSFSIQSPLPISSGSNEALYPSSGDIKILDGEQVEFVCPGNKVTLNTNVKEELVIATCSNGNFVIDNNIVAWENILCKSISTANVKIWKKEELDKKDLITDCFNLKGTNVISIGFQLESARRFDFIKICFDTNSYLPLYSYYTIPSFINQRVQNVPRNNYEIDTIYENIKVEELYNNSKDIINTIITKPLVDNKIYINRGHLAARADFFYASMQTATDRYINFAPQWNTFNGGNWKQIEEDVREYASNNALDLLVWTGTFGVLNLEEKDLYLKDPKVLPVPEIFWKLVYNSDKKTGVVFVGHNNPYLNSLTEIPDFKICEEKTENLKWINIDTKNATKGLSYACEYNDAKKHITFLPPIDVTSILL